MIDPYDRQTVEAIWNRVLAGRETHPAPEALLAELRSTELAHSREYNQFAHRFRPPHSALLRLSTRAILRAGRLRQLHRSQSGHLPVTASGIARSPLPLQEALRHGAEEAGRCADIYDRAASIFPREQRILQILGQEKRKDSQLLYRLAERLT